MMKPPTKTIVSLVAALPLLCLTTFSNAEGIKDLKIAEHISGPEVKVKALEGRVVVLELWGPNSPACVARMPHLVKMDRRYSSKGLTLIGVECEKGSKKEDVAKIIKKERLKFSIVKTENIPGLTGNSIPYRLIYGAKGALLWQGSPKEPEADKMLKKALKEVKLSEEANSKDVFAKKKDLVAEREWKNTDGKSLKAALISVKDGKGQFRRANGKSFEYAIANLSDEDQKLIKESAEKK